MRAIFIAFPTMRLRASVPQFGYGNLKVSVTNGACAVTLPSHSISPSGALAPRFAPLGAFPFGGNK